MHKIPKKARGDLVRFAVRGREPNICNPVARDFHPAFFDRAGKNEESVFCTSPDLQENVKDFSCFFVSNLVSAVPNIVS